MSVIHSHLCPGCVFCRPCELQGIAAARDAQLRALEALGKAGHQRITPSDIESETAKAENRVLSRGGFAPVRDADDHVAHIREHVSVNGREAQDHIQSHIEALRKVDPAFAPYLKES